MLICGQMKKKIITVGVVVSEENLVILTAMLQDNDKMSVTLT